MTLFETIVVVVAMVVAGVAAILHSLTPELAALLGVAVGYGAKGAVNAAVASPRVNTSDVFKGAGE